jgi:hypothetical protein
MKNITKTMVAALALSAATLVVNAQDAGGPPPDNQNPPHQGPGWQGGPDGPRGMNGHRPPPSPLMEALDANHDGVIDADEIANASAALKKLDKNGDGKLTPDELRPRRPQGGGGMGRPPGPDGQRPEGQQPPPPQNPPSDN